MTTPNPLHLASSAQQMARFAPEQDAIIFNKVAMICMGTMAAASVIQVLQPLLKSLTRRHEETNKGRGR